MPRMKELERDMLAAWASELNLPATAPDEEADRRQALTVSVLEHIAETPARTLAELRVKAMAIKVCHADEIDFGGELDGKLVASLLADLLPEK